MVVFFSPMGVKALYKNFPNFKQDKIKIGTFGQGTAKAAQDEGLVLSLQAPTPKYPSMTSAMNAFLRDQEED